MCYLKYEIFVRVIFCPYKMQFYSLKKPTLLMFYAIGKSFWLLRCLKLIEVEPWCSKKLRSRGIDVASVAGSRTSKFNHFPNFVNVSNIVLGNNYPHKFSNMIHDKCLHLTKAFSTSTFSLFNTFVSVWQGPIWYQSLSYLWLSMVLDNTLLSYR